MPRYIIERHVGDVSEADVEEASRRSKRVIAEMDGIVWIRSYVSQAEGKIYCEYEAPSEETVLDHARRAGLPADRIVRIDYEISPSMFV